MSGENKAGQIRGNIFMFGVKFLLKTHRSRSRVGDFVFVRCPVMLWSLSVGKRAIEGSSDVFHAVDTHCIAFKHRTEEKKFLFYIFL